MDTLIKYKDVLNIEILRQDLDKVVAAANIRTFVQWNEWLRLFCKITQFFYDEEKVLSNQDGYYFKQTCTCHFNHDSKKILEACYNAHVSCPVILDAAILQDLTIEPCLKYCHITVTGKHNHSPIGNHILTSLKTSLAIESQYNAYFNMGMSPVQAVQFYQCNLCVTEGIPMLLNICLCPKSDNLSSLYNKWIERHPKIEFSERENMVQCLQKYMNQDSELLVHLDDIGKSQYAVGVVTKLMSRVHNLPISSELVYIETIANRVGFYFTTLLCCSPVGPLPLGVLITNEKTKKCFTKGLRILKKMVGQDGFNKSNGPTVFVVNDCNALTGALNAVWPDSGHLINTTYALQEVWQWLGKSRSQNQLTYRVYRLKCFESILYSETPEECVKNFIALKDKTRSIVFWKYVRRWMKNKEQWCLGFRQDLIENKNTSSCQAFIQVLNELLSTRFRWFNAFPMVVFVAEVYDTYFKNRILNAISMEKKHIYFEPPAMATESISTTDKKHVFNVKDPSGDEVRKHEVDVLSGLCSCADENSGSDVSMCQHLKDVLVHFYMFSEDLYQCSDEEKQQYGEVALGDAYRQLRTADGTGLSSSQKSTAMPTLPVSSNFPKVIRFRMCNDSGVTHPTFEEKVQPPAGAPTNNESEATSPVVEDMVSEHAAVSTSTMGTSVDNNDNEFTFTKNDVVENVSFPMTSNQDLLKQAVNLVVKKLSYNIDSAETTVSVRRFYNVVAAAKTPRHITAALYNFGAHSVYLKSVAQLVASKLLSRSRMTMRRNASSLRRVLFYSKALTKK